MTSNQILKAIIVAELMDKREVTHLLSQRDIDLSLSDVDRILLTAYEPKYLPLPDYVLLTLLDEFIVYKRGPRDDQESPTISKTAKLAFNEVLKKLRVAFNLHEQDVREALKLATIELSKSDLAALFRKANHPLYKECDADLLNDFIEGLGLLIKSRG